MAERTVLIADDESVVRAAYRTFLTRLDGFSLAGEAVSGADAVAQYEALRPDLVLMDLNMPELDGIGAIREITTRWPDACVLALTTFGTNAYVVEALRAGAAGYLTKDATRLDLVAGMEQALRGDMPLSPAVRRELVTELAGKPEQDAVRTGEVPSLSQREVELLGWLAQGLTNAQIATRMHVSEGSVKQYLVRVGGKLDAVSRTQILIRSIQLGFVDPHAIPMNEASD